MTKPRPVAITVAMDPDAPPVDRHGEPVALGVALPRGYAPASNGWSLTDPHASAVPVQTTVLDRWGDGSVRWLLAEFRAHVPAGRAAVYALAPGAERGVPATPSLRIAHVGGGIRVETGAASFAVNEGGQEFLRSEGAGGTGVPLAASIVAEDADGQVYRSHIRNVLVERAGSLAAAVRVDGVIGEAGGEAWLEATVRLTFFAGLGAVRLELSVTNPRAARHPGGLWDLGDPGSILIRDLSVVLASPERPQETAVYASLAPDEPPQPSGPAFKLYQDSSGGPNWQHETHMDRSGRVPVTFRGFRAMRDGHPVEGLRATPLVTLGAGPARLSVVVPRFWELCPKSLGADAAGCTIGMFPRDYAVPHELQGGERATLAAVLSVGADTVTAEPLAWARTPLRAAADPESYRLAGLWAPLAVGAPASIAGYEALVQSAVEGDTAFQRRRTIIDEFGWRHFGEIYADHESVGQAAPIVSHYNNQYDAVAGCATRFLRTADHRWWVLADTLAAHVMDIDLYHTRRDRAAYNGGYFWHTQHYARAGTATHRAYSRASVSSGGGPSAEHNYTTGLMLHYFLTGAERSRAAVVQLADWVLDMDDGRKSRFRWIDRRDTGLASGTRSPDFHGPGRGAGNSINALLDAHRLTDDSRYMEKADALVARCVHPADDPAAIDPLDAENRWSYTVFLQALGKYLDHRAERGLIDARYAYARGALLGYANWMCENERPYLDTPERLEYPTETWAAQDIRKAAVFEFAARATSDAAARTRYLARAAEFVDYAVATLQQMPTGRLTRPIVLLLAYGVQRPLGDWAAHGAGDLAAQPWPRASFTPLRQRVMRKLLWAGAGFSAAALLAVVILVS